MKPPLQIKLRSGKELLAEKLGPSGYVAAPIGGLILGGAASEEHVGKFCVGVCYQDGQTGIIAQEEIAQIQDARGKSVPFGNPRYPGHPDFDPRDSIDLVREQQKIFGQIAKQKEERDKRIRARGMSAVLAEEARAFGKLWREDDARSEEGPEKRAGKKSGKKSAKKSSKKSGKKSSKKSAKKSSKKSPKKSSKKSKE